MLSLMFNRLKDPRGGQGRRYPLRPLLDRAVLATLAGCDSLRSLVRWCNTYHAELNVLLRTPWVTAPSFNAWRKVFKALGDTDFEPALGACSGEGMVLHVDGKALRGSVKKGSALTFLTSVFRDVDGVALMTLTHGKGEEAAAARAALARLEEAGSLAGAWLTFDALHTQKNSECRARRWRERPVCCQVEPEKPAESVSETQSLSGDLGAPVIGKRTGQSQGTDHPHLGRSTQGPALSVAHGFCHDHLHPAHHAPSAQKPDH